MRAMYLCLLSLGIALSGASVRGLDAPLTKQEQAQLTPAAREAYQKAVKAADHVQNDVALENLVAAKKADPGNVPLRLLTARFAITEAKKKMGEDAINDYRIAEKAYSEILDLPEDKVLPQDQKKARAGLEWVQNLVAKQAELDAHRMEVGKEIVQERAKELEVQRLKEIQAAKERENQGPPAGAAMGGMAGGAVPATGGPAAAMMMVPGAARGK